MSEPDLMLGVGSGCLEIVFKDGTYHGSQRGCSEMQDMQHNFFANIQPRRTRDLREVALLRSIDRSYVYI